MQKSAVVFIPDCAMGDARYDGAYRKAYADLTASGYAMFPDVLWSDDDRRDYGRLYGVHRMSRRFEMLALGCSAVFLTPFDNAPDMEVLHDACKRFGVEVMYYEVPSGTAGPDVGKATGGSN